MQKLFRTRSYRTLCKNNNYFTYNLAEKETDLYIISSKNISNEAQYFLSYYRKIIEDYCYLYSEFQYSLNPLYWNITKPKIIQGMLYASAEANVGPMATVAGAISHYLGLEMLKLSNEIIIENGGDVFIKINRQAKIRIFVDNPRFKDKITLRINSSDMPIGICTSSGKIGHSLSLGHTDATVILSKNTLLADAVATAVGNVVKSEDDIERGLCMASSINEVDGCLIIMGNKLGYIGDVYFA